MSENHPRHGDHRPSASARLGLECVRGGRPESIHPEAGYHARSPKNDTNASKRLALHPSSGLAQNVDSAVDLRPGLTHYLPGTVPRCLPEHRSANVLQSLTPRHESAGQAPFVPESEGRRPLSASKHFGRPLAWRVYFLREAYPAALEAAGNTVRVTTYFGMPHGFLAFPKISRAVPQALGELCHELRHALGVRAGDA